jgi:hypothetical protein
MLEQFHCVPPIIGKQNPVSSPAESRFEQVQHSRIVVDRQDGDPSLHLLSF